MTGNLVRPKSCWRTKRNTTKANKTLNFLRSNIRTCSAKSKEQAYKALVRSIVEYRATVWDPYVAKNIQQVEMIQRRAARWVLGRYGRLDSVTDMLSSLKWRSLELRRSDARLCMLYKQCNGLATYECDKLRKEHKSRMDTRLSSLCHRFEQPRCLCDYYKNSFYPRTIAQWNNLPPEIIASTSPCSFRQSLAYCLVILCYCCIHCCIFITIIIIMSQHETLECCPHYE